CGHGFTTLCHLIHFSWVNRAFFEHFACVFGQFSDSKKAVKRKMTKRIRFPYPVKRGSITVMIYRDRKPEGTYYRVVYYLPDQDGKNCRHRLNFHDLEAAIHEAELKASHLSRMDRYASEFDGKDRLEYARAKDELKEFNLPLDKVAIEYKEARKLLNGVPLS